MHELYAELDPKFLSAPRVSLNEKIGAMCNQDKVLVYSACSMEFNNWMKDLKKTTDEELVQGQVAVKALAEVK